MNKLSAIRNLVLLAMFASFAPHSAVADDTCEKAGECWVCYSQCNNGSGYDWGYTCTDGQSGSGSNCIF
jgi:hypothetical protein